ncbi:peptide chain release factor N(5)-glutamine methyltransferase [Pedobacter sp. SD-b]|uniref:peptide chain release factor N(5)-glutamine methyltransferase n=2 Tax=Pedobacter segetis TaxID=2793069 RepID=A0ABS1BK29_9SPHI|nr:peptide chain release factor N(5)-glutamine methyltransferase [Pedobacter segetis]
MENLLSKRVFDTVELDQQKHEIYLNYLDQLKQEVPIQYILAIADFYQLKFKVDKNVLIPRPETEELVHLIISDHKNKADLSILDIGTGSGCIPVALKKNITQAKVYAIDISEKALEIAKENALINRVEVDFILDDALNLLNQKYPKFDVIVSNPPYIAAKEKQELQKQVLNHEPHLALFVDDESPLVFYDKIADFAINNLNKNGFLYFEINQYLALETKQLIENKGFKVDVIKDMNDNYRIIKASF